MASTAMPSTTPSPTLWLFKLITLTKGHLSLANLLLHSRASKSVHIPDLTVTTAVTSKGRYLFVQWWFLWTE